ncbi:hypothetical protein [Vitreimonas flagellata]|uniref:hypothetical protein n=1 Tax=Vitreimonas flagellata TaxID=2560861 RepID=UPI001074C6F1|nr:hypothetical protein [Vitreimonas flagellata]
MISIGAVYRGPELKGAPINRVLMDVSAAIKGLRGPLQEAEAPWLNAVFVVPGSLGATGFRGLEFGEFSPTSKGLVVRIAVPSEVAGSNDPRQYVVDTLHGANAMAFEFFRQAGEDFDLPEAERLVRAVADRLRIFRVVD